MADDLGNDWWTEEKSDKSNSNKGKKEKPPKHVQDENTTQKRKSEQSQRQKKRSRMKLVEEVSFDSDKDEDERTEFGGEESINDMDNTGEDENVSKRGVKKKHSRRKITDELKEKGNKPICPSDLIDMLNIHYAGKLTKVELEDMLLDADHFALCNDLSHNPTSFMKALIPKWKKIQRDINQVPGSPLLLVLCPSALRAANFIRLISSFKGDSCKIAKLFAKHFKLEEQLKFLKSTVIHIGVGTANRIHSLLESGALHLDQVKYVILDWSWRDVKQKRLIDIPEVRQDTIVLLSKFIIPHLKKDSMKLALL